jgi:hypothetical protein
MKNRGSRRLIRRLGLALVVAAVLAPSAQAKPTPPDPLDAPSTQAGSSATHQHLIRLRQQKAAPRVFIRRSALRQRAPRRQIGGWE